MFEPPLKQAFTGSGGKTPRREEPEGLLDIFRAKAVQIYGPSVCSQLKAALGSLMDKHTEQGVARDVTTHITLLAISNRVNVMRDVIQQGGVGGYEKMKEATTFVSRLHKLGLEA